MSTDVKKDEKKKVDRRVGGGWGARQRKARESQRQRKKWVSLTNEGMAKCTYRCMRFCLNARCISPAAFALRLLILLFILPRMPFAWSIDLFILKIAWIRIAAEYIRNAANEDPFDVKYDAIFRDVSYAATCRGWYFLNVFEFRLS
jgi:hypothetical protein